MKGINIFVHSFDLFCFHTRQNAIQLFEIKSYFKLFRKLITSINLSHQINLFQPQPNNGATKTLSNIAPDLSSDNKSFWKIPKSLSLGGA